MDEGIRKERKALEFLKKDADYILDTSQLLTRELNAELDKIFVQDQDVYKRQRADMALSEGEKR